MKKGSTEWTPIYLVIVAIIAIILLLAFVKPLLRQSAEAATEQTEAAKSVAGAALFLLTVKR